MSEGTPIHEKYMRRCLELAGKGLGRTLQNPLVGSVIVHKGRIIGEGYHRQYGGPHAEVVAIESVKDKSLLKNSVLYVNLEPCSHQGKTPACSLLINKMKIPEVVIGCMDPNPLVAGHGIKLLKENGVRVTDNILKKESEYLNRRFFKFITEQRPWVVLKWAESKDGFLDKVRSAGEDLKPNWITNETARILVHKWRSEEAGIMAGVNTILTDNPKLNVRDWPGNNPLRIIIDRNNRIGYSFHVMDGSLPTIIFSSAKKETTESVEYIKVEKDTGLEEILKTLGKRKIISLLVEGGAKLLQNFIDLELWDEARVFTGNALFNEGVRAPLMQKPPEKILTYRNNLVKLYQRIDL